MSTTEPVVICSSVFIACYRALASSGIQENRHQRAGQPSLEFSSCSISCISRDHASDETADNRGILSALSVSMPSDAQETEVS